VTSRHPPVEDWATDFDHTDPAWLADPYPIWADLRQRCPVAHTGRYSFRQFIRLVLEDVDTSAGDEEREAMFAELDAYWLLLPFPAANRDPAFFEDPDVVRLDRTQNRHAAFGLGRHRCLGSHLARMELRVAIEEWLARYPDFELADPAAVTWSGGQVRGPRALPVRIG
jgi:hypothetical protein